MDHVADFTIVNSLRRALRGSDQDLKRECIFEIQQRAAINDLNKARIAAAGGIRLICSAMCNHVGNIQIQQYGCGALMTLAKNHVSNQLEIVTTGGINAIVRSEERRVGKEC